MAKKLIIIAIALFTISSFKGLATAASEIKTVEFDRLSDRDISPEGRAALSIDEKKWRHAETKHFVYHFTDEKEAETVYVHAEVYYKWVKELFGVKEDSWIKKNHIFIFSDEKLWQDFKKRVMPGRDEYASAPAFTTGWELFIYRMPYWLSPRVSLAHEITHIIMFRFLNGPIPLFLNEGFSQYISYRAVAMQFGGRYVPTELIQEKEFIPLKELIEMSSYPEDRLEVFYRESELLVRFLISTYNSKKFYDVINSASKGEAFKKSAEKTYGITLNALEEKFKAYAIPKN